MVAERIEQTYMTAEQAAVGMGADMAVGMDVGQAPADMAAGRVPVHGATHELSEPPEA